MASRAAHRVEAEPVRASVRITAVYTSPLTATSLNGTPAFGHITENLKISREESLGGAKGAMMALGIEAGAALCLFGAWLVLHLLR